MNAQPRVDGLFESLPLSIEENNLKSYVLANLTSDWKHLVKMFKNMITKRRSTRLDKRNNSYTFGNEKIRIGTQVLRYFHVSPLLMFTIFGNSPHEPMCSCVVTYDVRAGKPSESHPTIIRKLFEDHPTSIRRYSETHVAIKT